MTPRRRLARRVVAVLAAALAVLLIAAPLVAQDQPADTARSPADSARRAERRAADVAAAEAFWSDDTPLELTLRFDVRAVASDRDSATAKWWPMAVAVRDSAGATRSLEGRVRTRGIFRRKIANCFFPPLRLDIGLGGARGTPLAGVRRPKLVTHCRPNRAEYQQYLLQEYLTYEVLAAVTPQGYRARLARVTYEDAAAREKPYTSWAILVEDDAMLERRLGGSVVEQRGAQPSDVDTAAMTLASVFQYMIGNTDWSVESAHNVKLVIRPDGPAIPVLFDFDFAGTVNAQYAAPDPRLGLKSVRERAYRGTCVPEATVEAAVATLVARKDAILTAWRELPGLESGNHRRGREYLESFFERIGQRGAVRYDLLARCLRDRLP